MNRLLSILTSLALFFPLVARADVSIGASPAFIDIALDRGKTSAQTVLLFNSGKDPATVHAYAWDWWHEPGNARKFGPPGTLPHSAAKWISFIPDQITVEPGKAVNVTIVFNTPENAEGGHYAVAWFEAVPPESPGAKELRVGARLGVLLMTSVRGASNSKLAIQDLKITPPSGSHLLRADFRVANTGDVHLFPKGTLVIMGKNHQMVGHEGSEKRRLLPGEDADFSIEWGGDLEPGEYDAILTVDYGDENGATVQTQHFVVPAR